MLKIEGLMDIYSDFLISQNGQATATSLSAMMEGKISHDKITRLLNNNKFSSKELWKLVKPIIRKQESEAVLAIDDTIIEKPYSSDNEIICWHYSHAKGQVVKGIELMTCTAIYEKITIPISYELIEKTDCYEDEEENNKLKRRSTDTKNQRFKRLLDQAIKCDIEFSYILSDSWFTSKDNLRHIHYELNKKFIMAIKSNRLAAVDATAKKLTRIDQLEIESGTAITVYLKGLDFPVKLLKQLFTNEDGSSGTLYLITNDTKILSSNILEIYKKRWKIEEFHKSVKCNASAAKSPTKTPTSQANHLFASILAFCKLETLKLLNSLNHFALKAQLILAANKASFSALSQLKSCALIY